MTLPSTSQIIKKYGLDAKKSLGQNFILDKNFTDKIAKSVADLSEFDVLEVGPGPGSLTRSILDAKAKKLISIEKDHRCLAALDEFKEFYGEQFEVINDDALKINEADLFKDKFKIIANLPYNIGTVLLIKWLKIAPQISSMTLMLQKEVVQRIVAKPNTKHYGRLSVMTNFLCESKMLFSVNRNVFSPPPKVTSAILHLVPYDQPLCDVAFEKLEKVVAAAFNQRRKMVKSSLKILFDNPEALLIKLDINPTLRAENLEIEAFCKIAQNLPDSEQET